MNRKRAWTHFALLHAALILCATAFPLYFRIAKQYGTRFSGCLLHDWFKLYCPLCGGTRAVDAILHFRFAESMRANPVVVLLIFAFLICDLIVFLQLLMKKERILKIPKYAWIVLLVALVLYGILRNVLLIGFEIDPLGDLVLFWKAIKQ